MDSGDTHGWRSSWRGVACTAAVVGVWAVVGLAQGQSPGEKGAPNLALADTTADIQALRAAYEELLKRVGNQEHALVPRGTMVPYFGSALPEGYVWADGKSAWPDEPWVPADLRGKPVPDMTGRFALGVAPAATTELGGASSLADRPISTEGHVLTPLEMPSHDHGFKDNGHSHDGSRVRIATGRGGGAALWQYKEGHMGQYPTVAAANSEHTAVVGPPLSIADATSNIRFSAAGGSQPHSHPITLRQKDIMPPSIGTRYIIRLK